MKTRTSLILQMLRSEVAPLLRGVACALAVLGLVAVQSARAATIYWDEGGANKSWNTATNWDDNTLPSSANEYVLDDSLVGMTASYGLDDSFTIQTLTLNAAAMTDLDANTSGTDARVLTLNGSGSNPLIKVGTSANAAVNIGATGGVGTLSITLAASGSIDVASAKTLTIASAIGESGSRSLTKTSAGTLVLAGTNTYTGTTTISVGTLKLGATGDATNTPLGTVAAGTTVSATGAALDLGGFTLGTAEALSITGTGVGATGALTNSGAAASYSGIVTLAGAASIGGTGDISLGSGLATNANALTKVGTDTLTLSAASSRTGTVTISAGTLKVGANGAMGTNAAGVTVSATGAALDLNGVNYATASTLSLTGTGVSTTGALTNSGAPATYAGVVTIAAASTSIGGAGDITLSAALATTANSFVKVGAGKLTLKVNSARTGNTQIDNGTLRIESATAFGTTGTTITINAGTLEIGAAITVASGGGITFNNGGTISDGLAGNARIDKTITVQNSATAVVSFDSGTTATNVLTVNGGNNNRLTGGATGARIQIKGSGEVDVGDGGSTRTSNVTADWYLQSGKLRIRADGELGNAANDIYFQGGTLITGAGFTLGASRVLDFSNASGGTVDTTGGNLTLNTAGHLAGANQLTKAGSNTLYISAANAGFSGATTINAGTVHFANRASLYNDTPANWTPTNINVASAAVLAVGVGANASGYFDTADLDTFLNGTHMGLSTPTTGLKSGAILALDTTNAASATFTYNSNITDPGTSTLMGLTKIGAGTLVLGGTNTYTGNTTVSAGALAIASTSALPGWDTNGRYSVANGAGLAVGNSVSDGDFATIRGTTNFVAGSANGFDTTDGDRTYGPDIAGSIGLIKVGANKLILSGTNNTYTGQTTINGGTLSFSTSLPTAGQINFNNSGILEYTGASSLAGTYTIVGGNSNAYVNVTNSAGSLTATRPNGNYNTLVKDGSGTVTMYGYGDCGDVTVNGGTLILAGTGVNAGVDWCNIGSITDVKPGATVKLGNANGGQVFYQSAFNMSGGTFDANGQNPSLWQYSSLPTINGSGTITNSSAVASIIPFSTWNGNKAFSGNIVDGAGTVGVNLFLSGNTWTLSGINTYSGSTTITNGILQAGSTTAFSPNSAYSVAGGKTLALANFSNSIGSLTGAGNVTLGTATLTIGSDNTSPAAFSGPISGVGGSVIKTGTGTLTLSGTNTYDSGTTVNNGALSYVYTTAKPASGTTTVAAGATLGLGVVGANSFSATDVDNLFAGNFVGNLANVTHTTTSNVGIDTTAGNFTYASSVPATTRGLNKLGANTLILTGANAYTGPTIVSAGTLQIGDGGTIGSIATSSAITTNATLAFNRSDTLTQGTDFVSTISGSGGVTQAGGGTLVLNGVNNYTGPTTVTAGTLTVTTGTLARLDVPGGIANLNIPASALAANATGGQLNLNGNVTNTLKVTSGTVTVGAGATVGTADFSAGTGTVDATNPLTVTNMLNVNKTTITLGGGGTSFTLGGADVIHPTALSPRTITASGGTLTISVPQYATSGLVGRWTFDGSNANDSSGNGWNGTAVNAPTYSSTDVGVAGGKSLVLASASSQYVKVDTGGSQTVFNGGTAMTISAWVKGWPGAWNPFVCKNGEPAGWQMRNSGGSATNVDWTTRGLTSSDYGVTTTVNNGQWHLLTMTYDGSFKKVYQDGIFLAQTAATGTISATTDMLAFGARQNGGAWGNYFNGKLDDIYFYNRALTLSEVGDIYNYAPPADLSTTDWAVTATSGFSLPAGVTTLGNLSLSGAGTPQLTLSGATATGASFDNISATDNSSIAVGLPISLRTGNVTVSGTKTLTVDTNIVDGTPATTLNKLDNGTLLLTGANTYSGATTISNGTLALTGSGAVNSSSGITINGSSAKFITTSATAVTAPITLTQGTIGGTGTIGTAVTVGNLGILSPGASPGTLTVNNAVLTWAGGGTYAWQLYDNSLAAGTGWDLVDITGTGNLAVTADSGNKFNVVLQTLSGIGPDVPGLSLNWNASVEQSWKIASSAGAITGWDVLDGEASALFAIDATNFVGKGVVSTFNISKTGNDVFLNYVPEPATLVLLGLGGLGLILSRKRR